MKQQLFQSSANKGSLGDRFRAKRFEYFEKCLATLDGPVRILDIGGRDYFWINRGYHLREDLEITLINLSAFESAHENIKSIAGDATDLKQFSDNHFDIAFSNSVIEHLYTWENQEKMAAECHRIAARFFVQTPNKYFFIEPHYQLPFFNFFPDFLAKAILTKTSMSLGEKWSKERAETSLAEIRLLSLREFKTLFPGSTIFTEKFFGLRKSFTAHNFELP